MKFERVSQFCRAALDNFREISLDDKCILETYLNDELIEIFYRMNKMDQNHCLRVCKDVIKEKNMLTNNENEIKALAVAALLHDVGKSQCKSNIMYKVIFVLLKHFYSKDKLKWKAAERYYGHSYISFMMVQKYITDNTTLHLIRNHDNNKFIDDDLLLLRHCDDKN